MHAPHVMRDISHTIPHRLTPMAEAASRDTAPQSEKTIVGDERFRPRGELELRFTEIAISLSVWRRHAPTWDLDTSRTAALILLRCRFHSTLVPP